MPGQDWIGGACLSKTVASLIKLLKKGFCFFFILIALFLYYAASSDSFVLLLEYMWEFITNIAKKSILTPINFLTK